jgi:hypothetical protein
VRTSLIKTFKWLVVPVAFAAFGYFVVGRHLGQDAIKRVIAPSLSSATAAPPDDHENSSDDEAPDVDISVRRSR